MKLTFLAVLALLAHLTAHAQSDEDDLKAIYGDATTVSIATGSQKPLRLAPAVASVITAADIKAMGATDLDQVLETVPGLHVARYAAEYGSIYTIRGVYSELNPQVLVLHNGMPMTVALTGSKSNLWMGYPLQNVARIEIIRGPGSALYGADAYSGVINIVTQDASAAKGSEGGLGLGSFNTREVWARHTTQWGDVDVSAYLRIGATDGSRELIRADVQSGLDQAFGTRASLAPGPVNRGYDAVDAHVDLAQDKWHLRGSYLLRDNIGTGAGTVALDPIGKAKSERLSTDLSWLDTQFAPGWGLGFNASAMRYVQSIPVLTLIFPPGTVFPTGAFPQGAVGAPAFSEMNVRLSTFAQYSGWANHSVRIGAGHDDLDMYDTSEINNFKVAPGGLLVPTGAPVRYTGEQAFVAPQRRKVDYVYLQDEWQFAPDWALTVGLRHDNFSDVGTTTNPRLALVWAANVNLTAKLLYGQAFRAPSLNELYSLNNPVTRGNSLLKPETIKTLEAALIWQANKDTQLKLNVFQFDMQDIIRNVPDPISGSGAYANTGAQQGTGLEAEWQWQASRNLRFVGNYSNQRNIDQATNADAGYAPHHHLFARADWNVAGDWFMSPQLNWVADRKRALGDNRAPIGDYSTLDLTLRTTSADGKLVVSGSVRNLFDTDAREPSQAPGSIVNDLPLSRRSVYLQVSYRL